MSIFQSLFTKNDARKDVKLIPLSDMHTGGSTALFPYYNGTDLGFPPHSKMTGENGAWKFKHYPYMPTAKQYTLFQHFTHCAEQIAKERGNSRFIVVETGDSIEGKHHHTPQLATGIVSEQVAVHVWLMQYFLHKIGFDKNKGDLLYIGEGTEAHTEDEEDTISQQLGAELLPNGEDTFGFMQMDINSKRFWFLHQGPAAGRGITLGNSLHNWLKSTYFSCLEDGRVIPDVVMSGHYHRSVYDTFTRKDRTMHGLILPPWQLKTRFGKKVAAAELDNIGLRTIDISAAGDIRINPAMLLESREDLVTL